MKKEKFNSLINAINKISRLNILQYKIEDNNINYNNINTHKFSKEKFLDNVYLYDYEYKELVGTYGEAKANKCIEELSLYKKSKGI